MKGDCGKKTKVARKKMLRRSQNIDLAHKHRCLPSQNDSDGGSI
jgi:hypothetical protein